MQLKLKQFEKKITKWLEVIQITASGVDVILLLKSPRTVLSEYRSSQWCYEPCSDADDIFFLLKETFWGDLSMKFDTFHSYNLSLIRIFTIQIQVFHLILYTTCWKTILFNCFQSRLKKLQLNWRIIVKASEINVVMFTCHQ